MEGGCLCKTIRFKVEGDPLWVGACYCKDCRKASGAPYVVFAGYEQKDVTLLQGNPKTYASSEHVRTTFCAECGSPYDFRYVDGNYASWRYIPLGLFDDSSSFKITDHIWVSQKLPWLHIMDSAPQHER